MRIKIRYFQNWRSQSRTKKRCLLWCTKGNGWEHHRPVACLVHVHTMPPLHMNIGGNSTAHCNFRIEKEGSLPPKQKKTWRSFVMNISLVTPRREYKACPVFRLKHMGIHTHSYWNDATKTKQKSPFSFFPLHIILVVYRPWNVNRQQRTMPPTAAVQSRLWSEVTGSACACTSTRARTWML